MTNLFTTFLLFAFTISFSQEVKKRQITPAQIDAVFSQWDTPDKPGIAVGVLNDGEIVYTKGYGLANLEHKISISPETRFHIGDIAKEFTVYALLLLEQRGQLSLKDDIRKHMPELMSFPSSISIEQLLHHTSGLNNEEVAKALAGWRAEDVFTKKQAYDLIMNQAKSMDNSGSVQRFSDAGFMILEDLIAKISKMSYTDFITKEIFKPLGMTSSTFDQGTVIANKAQGYFIENDEFTSSTTKHTHTILSDVYTTVGDMCLWAKELRNPKIGTKQMVQNFDGLSVVDGKTVEEVNTSLYTGGHRYWNFRGAKKLYHVEVAGGYASKLIRYPDYDLAVVIMGNDGAYNGYAGTGASALYIEDFLNPPSEEITANITSKKLSKKQLDAFEGDYWDVDNYSTRKIHIVNDTLRYFRGQGNESPLVPLTKNSFKMITRGEVVVNFDATAVPKTMDVAVGDDTFHLIAFEANPSWAKDLDIFAGNYYAAALDTSYSLIINQGKLVITHPRLEAVQLSPRIQNVFTGNQRHFSSLAFERDSDGTVVGFHLATNGMADIWFQKEIISNQNFAKTK